ncbi:hypothetical protein VNI00_004457 [Paramarasmius palmivorus]|uniref:EthD domain-containing protein n=1 Tax=Paramarasmius palmivorus TaxID=297713 RepID=A0AAW0DI58_9AGAR
MGVPVIEGYDGVVLWDVESFDKVTEIWSSAEYFSDVVPDEEKFCDRKDAILVRLNIVSINDRSSEFPIPRTAASLPLLQEDRARMVCIIKRKEGTTMDEMKKHWLGEHIKVSSLTLLGKEMIKVEQNHLASPSPIVSFSEPPSDTALPDWDGITLIDTPSFDTFLYPEDAKALGEDNAKWLAPGKLLMLPVNVATIIDNSMCHMVIENSKG